MAIKGGQIIHAGNGTTVIDRVQTGGPGQVSIPTEKIYELGNNKSVATVRDTPDLTFGLESYDCSPEVETLVTNAYLGRSVSDAATTASDTTLTSATAAFTSADVGRMVIVEGGNTGGKEFVSTIESVTSATEVVVAVAPTATVSAAALAVVPNGIDLATVVPMDVASQFKAEKDAADPFKVVASVAVPFLYLEQMSYRFGLRDNATQSGQFRGDTIFYNPGATFVESAQGSGVAGQTVVTAHPAFQSAEGDARRVLSVTVGSKRLNLGADYTETYGPVTAGAATTTVTLTEAVPVEQKVRVVYASPDELRYDESVHADVAVVPAAIKGRDIEIYLGGYDPNDVAGSQANKLTSVQSVNADWRVQIDKDEEFGNYYAVGLDFDVPTVNGSIDIKPRDPQDLLALLRKTQGVSDDKKVLGTSSAEPLALDVVIKNPETGKTIKRLHVDDARFTAPGYQGRVQQKTTVSLPWESDEGGLLVFHR
jgi:hypothetical protein